MTRATQRHTLCGRNRNRRSIARRADRTIDDRLCVNGSDRSVLDRDVAGSINRPARLHANAVWSAGGGDEQVGTCQLYLVGRKELTCGFDEDSALLVTVRVRQ